MVEHFILEIGIEDLQAHYGSWVAPWAVESFAFV